MAEVKKEAKWEKTGAITDEALEKLRSKIGMKLRPVKWWGLNCQASIDTISHFADGAGDPNPLWRDEEYARKTRYGGIVAPPSFLVSVYVPAYWLGLSGVHAFHFGSDFEFYKPIYLDDKFHVELKFTGFDEKTTEFARKWIIQYFECLYYNQRDELAAKAIGTMMRAERSSMVDKGKYAKIQLPHPWTEEEVRKIEEEVLADEIRGSQTRYWEDVKEGEEIPQLVKGPLGITDTIGWMQGGNTLQLPAHSVALRFYQQNPGMRLWHPETHANELIETVHWNIVASETSGLPYPYYWGAQGQSWVIQSITHWMGDDGFLKRNKAEYRRFMYLSDVVWIMGKVVRKYVDQEGECCVDIESAAINQREENIQPNYSTVALPSKEKGLHPVERRLRSR